MSWQCTINCRRKSGVVSQIQIPSFLNRYSLTITISLFRYSWQEHHLYDFLLLEVFLCPALVATLPGWQCHCCFIPILLEIQWPMNKDETTATHSIFLEWYFFLFFLFTNFFLQLELIAYFNWLHFYSSKADKEGYIIDRSKLWISSISKTGNMLLFI